MGGMCGDDDMIDMTAVIRNTHGIHCRPSAVIVKQALTHDVDIEIFGKKGQTKLSSILELMSLELFVGSEIKIQVSGENEYAVCKEMVELFETEFDFPPQEQI